MYYIGLDVHKKTISYCVKDAAGHVHREGKIGSTRRELDAWIKTLPQPRMMAMEATIFTGWIYDHLLPHAEKVKVAHPLMLRAIAAAKKKNDRIDAGKIADCLRCDFLPECHMASTEIRDRRRILRYRNLVVKQMVQMKNRVSGLLMETGVSYNKQRLHKVGYFGELMSTNEEISESYPAAAEAEPRNDRPLREAGYDPGELAGAGPAADGAAETAENDPRSRPDHGSDLGAGDRRLLALPSIKQAISYCGLCSDEKSSADKVMRTPTLEAAQQAYPAGAGRSGQAGAARQSTELALIHEKERQTRNGNRATLAVARKMVGYMLAVERRQHGFRACRRIVPTEAAVKTFPNKEGQKHQDLSMRRLPGPAR